MGTATPRPTGFGGRIEDIRPPMQGVSIWSDATAKAPYVKEPAPEPVDLRAVRIAFVVVAVACLIIGFMIGRGI